METTEKTFEENKNIIRTSRDCAEQLSAVFNNEVQSEHFGNGRSLSVEGSSVECHMNEKIVQEFHSHFSDQSRQDASTTNVHMEKMFCFLKDKNIENV